MYHSDQKIPVGPAPGPAPRCLRHHVWMAACADCREAHALAQPRAAAER